MPDGPNKGSFLQGYDAQAAVDSTAQLIVAAEITPRANDSPRLLPMLKHVEAKLVASRTQSVPMRANGAKPTLRMKVWQVSICISPPVAESTAKLSRLKAGRRSQPRPSKSCNTNSAPRPGTPFTRCARPSSNWSWPDQGITRLAPLQHARPGQGTGRKEAPQTCSSSSDPVRRRKRPEMPLGSRFGFPALTQLPTLPTRSKR
jgi:hypothetical protein